MNSYRTENYIKDKVIVITGASSGFGKEGRRVGRKGRSGRAA